MANDAVTTRLLMPTDVALLVRVTCGNLNWAEQRFTEHDVTSRSYFRHYTQLVRERGDFGFVAESADERIGVVWAQFLPSCDPGFGFLDGSTPEISLWVRDDFRRQGVGRILLRRLQHEAIDRGIDRLKTIALRTQAAETGKRRWQKCVQPHRDALEPNWRCHNGAILQGPSWARA